MTKETIIEAKYPPVTQEATAVAKLNLNPITFSPFAAVNLAASRAKIFALLASAFALASETGGSTGSILSVSIQECSVCLLFAEQHVK